MVLIGEPQFVAARSGVRRDDRAADLASPRDGLPSFIGVGASRARHREVRRNWVAGACANIVRFVLRLDKFFGVGHFA